MHCIQKQSRKQCLVDGFNRAYKYHSNWAEILILECFRIIRNKNATLFCMSDYVGRVQRIPHESRGWVEVRAGCQWKISDHWLWSQAGTKWAIFFYPLPRLPSNWTAPCTCLTHTKQSVDTYAIRFVHVKLQKVEHDQYTPT